MKLIRDSDNGLRTFGVLRADDGTVLAQTLELPYKNNQHGVSAILAGRYTAFRFDSPHIGYTLFQLRNVPHRVGIDIHIGNTVRDTEGCILLGTARGTLDGLDAVLHSHDAFMAFMDRMVGVDDFPLTVIAAPFTPASVIA